LPTGDVFDEARFIESGHMQNNFFKIGKHNLFLTICEDIWAWEDSRGKSLYLENPLKKIKSKKIDLIVNSIENRVIISIQDNGRGISLDVQDKIFNPYFSTKSSGTGIGLAIAKRGIEQMNGKIYFQTEENKGTNFVIELPIA
jgi:hypothetical protein